MERYNIGWEYKYGKNYFRQKKDPYYLDRIDKDVGYINYKGEKEKLIALTKKNADFISSITKLDSNYKRECDKEAKPDEKYLKEQFPHLVFSEKDVSKSKGKYCGSQAYWFEKINNSKSKEEFKINVLGAVIAIDRANATHLETAENGRIKMYEFICKECKDVDGLKKALHRKYKNGEDDHLLNKMIKKRFALKQKDGEKFNLSFASKFCSIAVERLALGNEYEYSKYDGIVSYMLPYYAKAYLDEDFGKTFFKPQDLKEDAFDERANKRAKVYENYSNCIAKIIEAVKNIHGFDITREQLDNIIWYAYK